MKRALIFETDEQIFKRLSHWLGMQGISALGIDPRSIDPLQHEILIHDCRIDVAPCRTFNIIISCYNYLRSDSVNGMMILKIFRDSRCKKRNDMMLILIGGFPESVDMIDLDEQLNAFKIELLQSPFDSDELMRLLNR